MKKNLVVKSAVCWLALLTAACSKPAVVSEDIRPVRAVNVAAAQTSFVAELSGEVRSRTESRVGFQVAGRITDRRVEVGQLVKPGQVLATLDPADLRLGASAAQASLTAARVDRDQQRVDFKRFQELYQQGFISGAELDRRKASLEAAEARYASAAAQADVSGNQAAYTVLRAPEAGVVTAIDAEVGQVVSSGQSVVRIAQSDEKEVAIAIPENRLQALSRLSRAQVTVWSLDGVIDGRVREIAPVADPATRTYPARIQLLNAPRAVALGMTATVRFEAPLANTIVTVPLQALLRESDRTYVWKLDPASSTVTRSAVEIATVSGNDLVVRHGVAPGDVIVTAGVHLLKDGQKVKRLVDNNATNTAGADGARLSPPVAPVPGVSSAPAAVENAAGLNGRNR